MSDPGFPIVGIGASAGGIEAFRSFFEKLPADCGIAFVVILHLPPHRKSLLADIIRRWTAMKVLDAEDGTLVEPNCIYIPLPHTIVNLSQGRLWVQEPAPGEHRLFRPIDSFFDALGQALHEQAVGIVLSGTGSDGALGLKVIKACGGLTIAPATVGNSPEYPEMPAGAIATGSVDLVAPVDDIPAQLMRLRGNRLSRLETPLAQAEAIEMARLQIFDIVKSRLGHDFCGFRDKTFLRRVQRRMQVVGADTPQTYIQHLIANKEEVSALFRDLLISVTCFFRDADTFEVLQAEVIPRLFEHKDADSTVRIWVPGCATGEEAYSLAILLREHMDHLSWTPKVQLFATDIDDAAIATARLGRYPKSLLDGLSDQRRQRFFRPTQAGFAISREVRELCTFSEHNLLRDPPLSRMDMVSCRNLLIYLDTTAQESVIPVFHYALNPGGILLLGGAESVSRHGDLFEPLDRTARIFTRRGVKSPAIPLQSGQINLSLPAHGPAAGSLANGTAMALHTRGTGQPQHSARAVPAKTAAPAPPPLTPARATAERRPLLRPAEAALRWLAARTPAFQQLELRVASTQEELHSLAEEYQTALEDLRSANEELHSVNEEMQSTNEELETSKEELQSLNEELNTVNARLSEKVDELDAANSDLQNLFESTGIASVFLDRQLVIRSFTPAATDLYKLIPSDQGRPLTDIVSRFNYEGLQADVAEVLHSLKPLERRITRLDQARHYIMRILPYRTPDQTVSGTLITFIDVSSLVQAETRLREADVRKDMFIATLSHELRNPLAPIRTAAHLLQSPGLEPAQAEQLRCVIGRQVLHMSSLLDDLFDLSRISRNTFQLKKAVVPWKQVLNSAVETIRAKVNERQHTLSLRPFDEALTLQVDPVRLTQILCNLLTNAVKFTPQSGVIEVACQTQGSDFIFSVRDNGAGISPQRIEQIFGMFARGDSDVSGDEPGLGIGLALVKGLVELHGGRVQAHSPGLGLGSTFVVTLPHAVVGSQGEAAVPSLPLADTPARPRRVLIADDNRDGADTLATYLSLEGHAVWVAYTGEQALQMAGEHVPDACVLDIGMPGLTGFEVARHIRSEHWGQHMLLVAVTGWGQESDKAMARASGFDHHLTKPIDPVVLNQLIVGAA
jgi:two-component system CheB/CheR fusion protein